MITAIGQYKLPPHIDLAACAAHFRVPMPPCPRPVRGTGSLARPTAPGRPR
jgi:hypothetical protein